MDRDLRFNSISFFSHHEEHEEHDLTTRRIPFFVSFVLFVVNFPIVFPIRNVGQPLWTILENWF